MGSEAGNRSEAIAALPHEKLPPRSYVLKEGSEYPEWANVGLQTNFWLLSILRRNPTPTRGMTEAPA